MSSGRLVPAPLPPSPIALMLCPLCFEESGQRIAIVAEYRFDPAVTVAHLIGCQHGARFGQAGGLTFTDRHRMTRAALEMWDAAPQDQKGEGSRRSGPVSGATRDPLIHASMIYGLRHCRDRSFKCGADRPRHPRRGRRSPR